ncbi:MAG: hypothetical protein PHO32_09135, partial [Candidatus Cloacimonetes bacterium]|nr:hypothetical protein [Candidatus Cloacimonadota bacterium]
NESLLIDLYEEIRHSDKSGSSMLDDKIDSLLLELENNLKLHTGVDSLLMELKTALTQRSVEIVLSKKGLI